MSDWSVQDWCAVIALVITVISAIYGFILWLKKLRTKPAVIRANFFKQGKSWRFRIYNSSNEDIEAKDVRVFFDNTEEFAVQWNSDNESFPSLKRHSSFDIYAMLYTSSPRHTTVVIKWRQDNTSKEFTTSETVSLNC